VQSSGANPTRSELLSWVEQALGDNARIVAKRPLTGGLTSLVQELTVVRGGRRTRCVLRSWPSPGAPGDWMARAVESEAAILAALERTDVPAPRLIAFTNATSAGGPALLMTRVSGRILLMPRDREGWLRQMARMLARIHALGATGTPFEPWLDADRLSPPPDASRPEVWREAFALVAEQRHATGAGLIHRDYQHFNLLWSRERLTGVVDWGGACIGPPGIDLGHCRLNLTLLFSADIADQFRDAYESETGRATDPYWDIHALLSYGPDWKDFLPLQINGRAPFDVTGMTRRMEDVLARALRRV
jgi:aminoglycoside phosphotransferase (APT) family kinase protein